ncbi:MAG: RHS repeat-associated core domain-containing protein [Deltaproteobacteria bacterium]|nr:RHS repeat-associated core domain-containing protein [Deltaproteobacteria bacterium]
MDSFRAKAFHSLFALAFLFLGAISQAQEVFYLTDHLGSTRVVTDASGNEQAHYTYYPYGEIRGSTSNPQLVTADYLYTNQEHDIETDLCYYGARYYEPAIARFISVDPKGFRLQMTRRQLMKRVAENDLNSYAYVANNPLKYIDPNGEDKQVVVYVWSYPERQFVSGAKVIVPGGGTYLTNEKGQAFISVPDAISLEQMLVPGGGFNVDYQGRPEFHRQKMFGGRSMPADPELAQLQRDVEILSARGQISKERIQGAYEAYGEPTHPGSAYHVAVTLWPTDPKEEPQEELEEAEAPDLSQAYKQLWFRYVIPFYMDQILSGLETIRDVHDGIERTNDWLNDITRPPREQQKPPVPLAPPIPIPIIP